MARSSLLLRACIHFLTDATLLLRRAALLPDVRDETIHYYGQERLFELAATCTEGGSHMSTICMPLPSP